MASRATSRKHQVDQYLRDREPGPVSEAEWYTLLGHLAPVSPDYLRRLLYKAGAEVQQPFGGIHFGSLDELEASLASMEEAYQHAVLTGDRTRAALCRRVVIEARRKLRLLAANSRIDEFRRAGLAEMDFWLRVWLENPPIFRSWVALRRKQLPAEPVRGDQLKSPE